MNNEDKKLEAIAEQWVNIIFAQIEVERQDKKSSSSNKNDDEGRLLPEDWLK